MRNTLVTAVALVAGYFSTALAQQDCLSGLSAQNRMSEILTCLKASHIADRVRIDALQAEIDALRKRLLEPSDAEISRIASALIKEHRNELKGEKGDDGSIVRFTPNTLRQLGGFLAENYSDKLRGPEGKPGRSVNKIEIPVGLVAAFHRSELGTLGACPPGWSFFRDAGGRFIVGAGAHNNQDENDQRLTRYPSHFDLPDDATGGAETHVLGLEEVPEHVHSIPNRRNTQPSQRILGLADPLKTGPTELVHGAKVSPHNNMPPYIALYFCKKE